MGFHVHNRNLAGYLEFSDGKTAEIGKVVDFPISIGNVAASGITGELVKFVPSSLKDFINFKVYGAYNGGTFSIFGTPTIGSITLSGLSLGNNDYYI